MSPLAAASWSFAICLFSAFLEGVFAGKQVRPYLASLRAPAWALPFWAWCLIGLAYYLICAVLLWRLFRLDESFSRDAALVILLSMMSINAAFNWVFFRSRDLFASFLLFIPYNVLALCLVALLASFDTFGALVLTPYAVYLLYANAWGYSMWKLNRVAA